MEFEALYRSCFSAVYRYLRQLTGSEQLAEELTAETFFKAMQQLEQFRGECDVRVWLCQIGKNTWYSWQKKHKRQSPLPVDELPEQPSPAPGPEELACDRDTARRLRAALHRLPEPYREVFLWRVYGQLSFGEIGELFGKTDNWACVTYHRARNRLREEWEDEA